MSAVVLRGSWLSHGRMSSVPNSVVLGFIAFGHTLRLTCGPIVVASSFGMNRVALVTLCGSRLSHGRLDYLNDGGLDLQFFGLRYASILIIVSLPLPLVWHEQGCDGARIVQLVAL